MVRTELIGTDTPQTSVSIRCKGSDYLADSQDICEQIGISISKCVLECILDQEQVVVTAKRAIDAVQDFGRESIKKAQRIIQKVQETIVRQCYKIECKAASTSTSNSTADNTSETSGAASGAASPDDGRGDGDDGGDGEGDHPSGSLYDSQLNNYQETRITTNHTRLFLDNDYLRDLAREASQKRKDASEWQPTEQEKADREQAKKRIQFFGCLEARWGNDNHIICKGERPESPLVYPFINEGRITIIVGRTNAGKSIAAVQAGIYIAEQGKKVLYADFEMGHKQVDARYQTPDHITCGFPSTWCRVTPKINDSVTTHDILQDLDNLVDMSEADVLIIDNITFIADKTEKAGDVINVLKGLKAMQTKYNTDKGRAKPFTMVIVCHTPKRDLYTPLTINDIAGSHTIAGFADDILGLQPSAKDRSLVFAKQLKTRESSAIWDEDSVPLFEITKAYNGLTYFKFVEMSTEAALLRNPQDTERDTLEADVCSLRNEGLSMGQIAKNLGITKSKVQRILTKTACSNVSQYDTNIV